MAQKKWLVSDEFSITVRSVLAPGNKSIDLIMIVEPEQGISDEVANIIKQPEFGFKTNGKGYWVTSKFINKERKLNLAEFGSKLVASGIAVRVKEVDTKDLRKLHDDAIARGNDFQLKKQANDLNQYTANLVGLNLQGEEVYEFSNGLRAVPIGQGYATEKDASNDGELKRFLINGSLENQQINVDIDFLTDLVVQEIKDLSSSEKWTEESTIGVLQKLIRAEVQDADNLVQVINACHKNINKSVEARYLTEISEDAVKANGEMKALRTSSIIYSKLVSEFDDEGNVVQNYLPPIALIAKRKLESTGVKVVDLTESGTSLKAEFDALGEGESAFIIQRANSHAIGNQLRNDIASIRTDGDILSAFDLKETQHSEAMMLYRIMKLKKSQELVKKADFEELPNNFMSTSQFSESAVLLDMVINQESPLPLNRNKLEDALKVKIRQGIKEVEFVPTTTVGTMPSKYVVPASLAAPQKKAVVELIEKVGDLGEYLANKLKLDLGTINTVFSKVQVEHISMAINRHEEGFGFIIGDGTGTGKTRQMAALMRYQALNEEQILFASPDKDLLRNLWKEIKILQADQIIVPFIAATEPLKDEDGNYVVFSTGETSEGHYKQFKKIIESKSLIPGKYNAVFTTYSTLNQSQKIFPESKIANYNPNFDKPLKQKKQKRKDDVPMARVYDPVLALAKFSSRADTYLMLDEAHLITGESNTKVAIKEIQSVCTGKAYASATAMKNARRVAPYADAMRVPMTPSQLKDILILGGEPALEAFSASLTEEGGYVRAEMPTSEIEIKNHIDEQNTARYEVISDSYSEIMQVYLRMLAYINKAKAVAVDEFKFNVDPENFKPSNKSNIEIGLNTTGFTSRFTKTNELFVACLKSDFIAEEAIEIIRSGGKALIPIELTSEANIKFIQETYDVPKFTEKQVKEGKVKEWIEQEKAKDPNFKGVPDNFKDVLARMFIQSRQIKIPHLHNGKKDHKFVDMLDLVKEHLSTREAAEFEALITDFDSLLENFPQLTANPYDNIINKVKREGFKADSYAGRHIETRETEEGYTYFVAGKTKSNEQIRESFQNDELDCVVMGRSGWAGKEWQAVKEKPVTLVYVIPPTSADLEKQLEGRVNRTGQTHTPKKLFTSTGLVVESRMNMQAIKRLRDMNATSKGDANMDANEDDVQLFSHVGIEAVKRYLLANVDVMEKLGLNFDDIEASYTGGASIATVFTSRAQLLKNKDAKQIMNEVVNEYHSVLNELEEMGIQPFGQPIMDVEAKISKGIQVDGIQNSDNPWQQPVYLSTATFTERLVIASAKDVLQSITENEEPKNSNDKLSQILAINNLKATQRFDAFSKHLQTVADDTYNAIRKLTSTNIDDISPSHGKLFHMRQKYERASEMSQLLQGMKLGQIVRLSLDASDISNQVEGVVTDIQMMQTSGYSPTLTVSIPGEADKYITAHGAQTFNLTKTALMFNAKSALANKFDSQNQTVLRERVIVSGPPFATIMKAASILKSNGHKNSNAVKIVNMSVHDIEKGKYIQKVALLPKDMTLTSVMSSPMELNASQCANYIKFAGNDVRVLTTSPSKASMGDYDLSLTVVGSDATGGISVVISGNSKNLKKLCDDEKMQDFGVDPLGNPGFGAMPRTKRASIEIEHGKMFEALTHLEEEYGIRFYSSDFGMKFIQDFNAATLPSDYKTWLKGCREELINMYKDHDTDLDLNEIINNTPAAVTVKTNATAPTP